MLSNRVLVVEDDPSVRGLLQTILEDEALEVILAADGEEGLRLARTVDLDVVLLDVMMPGLGGLDVIRRPRRADGLLPFAVLVVTGAAEVIALLRSELGPEAVLEKPFDITTLATRVKTLASGNAQGATMSKLDFLSIDDVEPDELTAILDGADRHKADRRRRDTLGGRSVALVFEKPSTRTRVSPRSPSTSSALPAVPGRGRVYSAGARPFRGHRGRPLPLRPRDRARTAQESLERLARGRDHPGGQRPTTPIPARLWPTSRPSASARAAHRHPLSSSAYLGDGNNVAHSLPFAGAKMGMHVAMATPVGYEPIPQVVRRAIEIAAVTGGSVELTHDPSTAAKDADVKHRRLGLDGQGDGARRAGPDLQALPAVHRHGHGRRRRRRGPPLPACPPGRGDRRRGHGRPQLGRVRPGREPPPHPEGPAVVAAHRLRGPELTEPA